MRGLLNVTRREWIAVLGSGAAAAWLSGGLACQEWEHSGSNGMDEALRKAISSGAPEIELHARAIAFPLVRIAPGQFMMGSPVSETGHQPNEPLREVQLTKPFYIGKYQVTQGQFKGIMASAGSKNDAVAADQILYSHAIEFCRRLSAETRAAVQLPTEAQWEYACRAGTQTRFYTGDSEADLGRAAWYRENSAGHVHAPGEKAPNAWGLYDTLGNLWELCSDFIGEPDSNPAVDLVGERSASFGAMRGGGWMEKPESCRAARRSRSNDMFGGAGIRIAITV